MSLNQQHLWACPCHMCPCLCLVKIHFLKQMATAILLSVTIWSLHMQTLPTTQCCTLCNSTLDFCRSLLLMTGASARHRITVGVCSTVFCKNDFCELSQQSPSLCAIWKSVCSLLVSNLLFKFPKISYRPLLWINLMRANAVVQREYEQIPADDTNALRRQTCSHTGASSLSVLDMNQVSYCVQNLGGAQPTVTPKVTSTPVSGINPASLLQIQ